MTDMTRAAVSRRHFLQLAGAGMLALTGTALAGCGNSTSSEGSDKGSKLAAIKSRGHLNAGVKNKVPGLEPDRVRALNKREAFIASRRRRRQAPEAGADLRSKYADVPLPAPWSKEDFGNGRFSPLCSRTSPDLGMPLKPVRICEANARTSPCSLQFQNVRLMPAAHTCTCARYNGWVTTNVPITKKEPL